MLLITIQVEGFKASPGRTKWADFTESAQEMVKSTVTKAVESLAGEVAIVDLSDGDF